MWPPGGFWVCLVTAVITQRLIAGHDLGHACGSQACQHVQGIMAVVNRHGPYPGLVAVITGGVVMAPFGAIEIAAFGRWRLRRSQGWCILLRR